VGRDALPAFVGIWVISVFERLGSRGVRTIIFGLAAGEFMRRILPVAVLVALFVPAAEAAGPAPVTRTRVVSIDNATITHPSPTTVGLIVEGRVLSTGWTDASVDFLCGDGGCIPYWSGIVEARMMAVAPTGMAGKAPTRISTPPIGFGEITPRLKGFHICGQANCLTILLDGTIDGGKTGGPVTANP
jgi:hypothetical protein